MRERERKGRRDTNMRRMHFCVSCFLTCDTKLFRKNVSPLDSKGLGSENGFCSRRQALPERAEEIKIERLTLRGAVAHHTNKQIKTTCFGNREKTDNVYPQKPAGLESEGSLLAFAQP